MREIGVHPPARLAAARLDRMQAKRRAEAPWTDAQPWFFIDDVDRAIPNLETDVFVHPAMMSQI